MTVDVSFPASLAADVNKVKREAEKKGFQNLSVSKQRPGGWPGANGSYYVTGTYGGGPAAMERSYAGGQVSIKDVWEG